MEAAPVQELREATDALRALLRRAGRDGDVAGLRQLIGVAAMVEQLARMEPSARRAVWILQGSYYWDPEDPGVELTYTARDRGVETLLITRLTTLEVHPLLPSIFPTARTAPVFTGLMIIDEREAMIAGEDSAEGHRTVWVTDREDLVRAAVDLWHRTYELSAPVVPPGAEPPLTRRQLRVAQLLAVGEKNQAIARRLGLSGRTVEREVSALLRELGAHSRAEAVLLMRGRGVNGGRPLH